ncbi:hypothetical protein JMUB7532_27450 [Staphylococcus aureus]
MSRGLGDVYKRQPRRWRLLRRERKLQVLIKRSPVSYTHLTLPTTSRV